MSNERADEFLPWRGRLTPADALPEQGLEEKELTWQRLAERLQKKPRRRFAAWWIAAACFVLAFLPASHLFRTRPAHPPRIALHPAARQPVAPLRGSRRERPTVSPAAAATAQPAVTAPPAATVPPAVSVPAAATVRPAVSVPAAVIVPAVVKTLGPTGRRPTPESNYGEFATIKKTQPGLPPSSADTARVARPGTRDIVPTGALLAAIAPLTPPEGRGEPTPDRRGEPTPDRRGEPTPDLRGEPIPENRREPTPDRAAARRPLRIVYLNELDKTSGLSPVAGNRPPALRLGAAANTADWTANQQNTSLLKIDLTSHNH